MGNGRRITLSEYIGIMHIAQKDVKQVNQKNKNMNDLKSLVKFIQSGKPNILYISNMSGTKGDHARHAVNVYGIDQISSNEYYLYIYDSNHPFMTKDECYVYVILENDRD